MVSPSSSSSTTPHRTPEALTAKTAARLTASLIARQLRQEAADYTAPAEFCRGLAYAATIVERIATAMDTPPAGQQP